MNFQNLNFYAVCLSAPRKFLCFKTWMSQLTFFCAALKTESLFSLVFPLLAEWLIKGYVYQDVRGYNVKNDVDKANVKKREGEIGPILKQRLNLEACSVRQGSGTSNCGNTSRRAFAQPEIFADIVNMPVDLIKESVATVLKFHVIFYLKPSVSKVLQTHNEFTKGVVFFKVFFFRAFTTCHYQSMKFHNCGFTLLYRTWLRC